MIHRTGKHLFEELLELDYVLITVNLFEFDTEILGQFEAANANLLLYHISK